jgi:hypothetical protein
VQPSSLARLMRPLAGMVAAAGMLAACIEGAPICDSLLEEIDVTISAGGDMAPADPAVCRGDEVTLRITSDTEAVFHVHGFDETELPATSLPAGETVEVTFTAVRSGQFPVEIHTDENPQGISTGLITIHEP